MKYLFYILYSTARKGKGNTPVLSSILIIGFLQGMNVITGFLFISYLMKMPIEIRNEIFSKTIVMGILIYAFDYFYLYKNKDSIINKYDNRSSQSKIRSYVVLAVYVICTVVLFQITHDLPYFLKDGTQMPIK